MTGLLLDTHVWYRYRVIDEQLPDDMRRVIDDATPCWVSPVSSWELGLLARRGRVRFVGGVREWVELALESLPVQEAPVTRDVALTSNEVDLPHRDSADRFLAATALVFGLTPVTLDTHLLRADWLPTYSG